MKTRRNALILGGTLAAGAGLAAAITASAAPVTEETSAAGETTQTQVDEAAIAAAVVAKWQAEAAMTDAVAAHMRAQAEAEQAAMAAAEAQAAAEAEYYNAIAANMQAQAAAAAPAAAPAAAASTENYASGDASAWANSGKSMSVKNCESGNNYSTNTGNGYYGAWQFDLPSWLANGGGAYAPRPDLAPAWAQDQVAYNYYQAAGWGPWSCG
jgi:hypothetical protein